MTPDTSEAIDAARAASAETVRQALVRLRGGAPFLSPRDAGLLVGWLDAEVPVATILAALERAAEKRRASRQRVPLCLAHAKRYLRTTTRPVPAPLAAEAPHPMHAFEAAPPSPSLQPQLQHLVATLRALPAHDPGALADRAADAVLAFFDQCWCDLGSEERARYEDEARAALGDALGVLDEAVQEALVEEHARSLLRDAFPTVSVAHVLSLVSA